jgi:hypothetical protein
MTASTAPAGVTIIVLTHDRPGALRALLAGLLQQELEGMEMELLVCNNSSRSKVSDSPLTRSGRLLGRFKDVKVFNSSYNWLCRIRYTLAMLARHDVIMFLDDDLTPVDPHLVGRMASLLATLGPHDIVSCWTSLWTAWDEERLTKVRMGFLYPKPTVVTEVDYIGPGICMFNKRTLLHPSIMDLKPEDQASDSGWFPWLTTLVHGTRKYYMPSHGMLKVHPESKIGGLTALRGFREGQYAAFKRWWKLGYKPVLSFPHDPDSPEVSAAREFRREERKW